MKEASKDLVDHSSDNSEATDRDESNNSTEAKMPAIVFGMRYVDIKSPLKFLSAGDYQPTDYRDTNKGRNFGGPRKFSRFKVRIHDDCETLTLVSIDGNTVLRGRLARTQNALSQDSDMIAYEYKLKH